MEDKMKDKKEQKLTKAELKRKEVFEKTAERLAEEGYTQNLIKLSGVEVNFFTLLLAIPFIVPVIAVFLLMGHEWDLDFAGRCAALLAFILLVVVHEFLHGLAFSWFTNDGWKSIAFGFNMKYWCPYCNCLQPLKKKQIITTSLLPTLVLGYGLGITAIITGSPFLLAVSVLNIIGGGGDLLVITKILRYKTACKDVLYIDHPYEIGTAVFER